MTEKVCTNCIFCKIQDYGYSNYTVEGSTGSCLFNLVPEFENTSYPDEQQAKLLENVKDIAEKCPHFTEGTGLYFDCDGEDIEQSITDWRRQYVK